MQTSYNQLLSFGPSGKADETSSLTNIIAIHHSCIPVISNTDHDAIAIGYICRQHEMLQK